MYTIFLSIDLFRSVIFLFGYSTVDIPIGIRLASLLASFLYLHNLVLWLLFAFSLAVIIDMLYKLKMFDLTTPNASGDTSVSWHLSACHELLCFSMTAYFVTFLLTLLHVHSKLFALLHLAQFLP